MSDEHPDCDWHLSATEAYSDLLARLQVDLYRASERSALEEQYRDESLRGMVYAHNVIDAVRQVVSRWSELHLGPSYLFLSYAREDLTLAEAFDRRLTARGVRVFLDQRSIPLGTQWKEQIYQAIHQCSVCVCLVTPAFLRSDFCAYEVATAFAARRDIRPLLRHVAAEEFHRQFPELVPIECKPIHSRVEEDEAIATLIAEAK